MGNLCASADKNQSRGGPQNAGVPKVAAVKKPILAYWDVRGLGEPLRYQLIYSGVKFEDKAYTDRETWGNDKKNSAMHFPNLPSFTDKNGFQLSETQAIHQYCAAQYKPELLGKDVKDRATVEMLYGVLKDWK